MPNENNHPSPGGSGNKWLLAAIPALAVIAFMVYSAVVQAKDEKPEGDFAPSSPNKTQDAAPPADQSGK